jgi:hypothetical protein
MSRVTFSTTRFHLIPIFPSIQILNEADPLAYLTSKNTPANTLCMQNQDYTLAINTTTTISSLS